MNKKIDEIRELENNSNEDDFEEVGNSHYEEDEFEEVNDENTENENKNKSKNNGHGNDLVDIEETILSIILNNKKVPENVNEHVFSNLNYKEVFKGISHFSNQDKDRAFEPDAVGILLSKRRNNDTWKDTIIPDIILKTEGQSLKVENYLSILKEEQVSVRAREIADEIVRNVNKGDIEYLKKAASELNDIEIFESQGYDTLDDAVDIAMFELHEKINSDSELSGVPTGIPTLDDTIGGLQKSDLVILAARPGQGKTATAINFAYNSNASCGFISSEMPSSQLATRLLSLDSGVNAQKLRNPKKLNKDEVALLVKSSLKLKEDKELYITDKPSISIQEVKEIAKKWKEKYDIKVLFIDYLQRLTYKAPGSENMPRHERVGMIALEAKEIARELDISVVGLAQISRGSEKNEATGGQPMLSDLKDSGMLEQEADLVICPYRSNTSGMDVNSDTEMVILILKNRHGPLGEIPVIWTPKNMKISENVSNDDNYYYDNQAEGTEEEEEEENDKAQRMQF